MTSSVLPKHTGSLDCLDLQLSGLLVQNEAGRQAHLLEESTDDSDVHLGMGTLGLNFPNTQLFLII